MIEATINKDQLAQITASLQEFERRVTTTVVNNGLRAGARMMGSIIQEATPVRQTPGAKKLGRDTTRQPGNLRRSITWFKKKKGVPRGQVQWAAGPRNFGDRRGFYGVMVEKGHVAGKRKKYGLGVTAATGMKMVPAHPFMLPAFNSNVDSVIQVVINDMEFGVLDAAKRARLKELRGTARL